MKVKMLHKAITIMAIVICAVSAGCQTQAHAESKKLAKQRWAKHLAVMKVTMAQQQYRNGRLAEAAKTIKQSISANPEIPQAHLVLGKILLAKGNTEEAIGELRLAVELDEKLAEGWYWLGIAEQQNGQIRQAWFHYNKAMKLDDTNVDYVIAAAQAHIEQDEFGPAARLLEEKMEVMPKDVSLKVAAADLMLQLEKKQRAVELYEQAMLMTDDGSETIAESLGYYYVSQAEWDKAAEVFNKLANQCQDRRRKKLYLQMMAVCSMNSQRYAMAVSGYDKLSIDQRDNAEIWLKMGQAALGAGAANRALVCGQKALALQPDSSDAVVLIGCAQYAGGDYAAAANSFEKISANEKNSGLAWLMRARCYEQLGQKQKAHQAYKKALEINPDSKLGKLLAMKDSFEF